MQRSEKVESKVVTQFMQALNEQGLKLGADGKHNVQHKPGVATFVESLRFGVAYVVTFTHADQRAHTVTFEPEEGNPADKARARIAAQEFYLQQQPSKERMN